MYLDGLEIAGIGVGMVFLALVVILVAMLVLRSAIDRVERRRNKKIGEPASAAPSPQLQAPTEEPPPTLEVASGAGLPEAGPDRSARAAAIAVALFMTEEDERGAVGD
ncbi:MAG: OadG family transporter subunit [Dehalococcoidia bacterium]